MVPIQSDTIRLVQNECSFHELWSEDPNQHLKDFLKLVDSLDLDVVPTTLENPEQAFVEYASSRTDEAGVLSARSYSNEDPQCSTQTHGSINAIIIHTKQQSTSYDNGEKENKEEVVNLENTHVNPPTPPDPSTTFITEKVLKFNSFFESLGLVPPSSNTELVCTKEEDGDVMFIEIVLKDDNSRKEEPKAGEQEVEYFDILPTRSELVIFDEKKLGAMILSNSCLALIKLFVLRISASWVISRAFKLPNIVFASVASASSSHCRLETIVLRASSAESAINFVKENQEKDKIGSKPDKKGKHGEAGKILKQLQLKEEEKLKKTKKEWPKTHTRIKSYATLKKRRKEKGHKCNSFKVQPQGPVLPTAQTCMARDLL
nr:MAK10-like protein [Tanacetum cinerariifolium]